MFLKRKRSEDELSSFSSGSRIVGCSSPMRSDHGDVVMMDTDSPISPHSAAFLPSMQNRSRSCTPSYLPSRTIKRLRNGRPSEQEVHQNTLKMLYQAQRHSEPHHVFSPALPTVSMASMPAPQTPLAQSQPSLHNFWKLPTPARSPQSPAPSSNPSAETVHHSTVCEDCGVGLSEEDAMMDDGYGFETYINACSVCARAVCFSCSVGNLGEQRRCLCCAGREKTSSEKNRKWVGGLGWTVGGVTVC